MFQPHEGELGIAPTVSAMQTFAYSGVPQCCVEGGIFWTLLGNVWTNAPVAHDKVTPVFLPISLSLWNPSIHQGISDISPYLL